MTPELLAQYLDVMRKAGLMSAQLKVPLDNGGDFTMAVVLGPDPAQPLPGEEPTPGGWKGPDRLDAEFSGLDDEAAL